MHVFNPFPSFPPSCPNSSTIPPFITPNLFLSYLHYSLRHFNKHLPIMAKVGKLTKLKSAMKRLPSLPNCVSAVKGGGAAARELHVVYVGKSRRRYLVNSNIMDHPVFQELVVERSSSRDDGVVVSREVVLFEHLLWMLECSETQQLVGSMDELVEFYNCAC